MRVTRLFLALTVVSSLTVLAVAPARGAGCQSEVARFCKGEKAKQILACLQKNQKDLSPGCSTYLNLFEQIPSCLDDASRLCPTEHPSLSSLVGCLRGRSSDLSAECHAELEKIH